MQKAFLQCVMSMWTFKLFRNVAQHLHLSFVFQMKVVVCSLVLPYIGKLCDSQKIQMIDTNISSVKYVERFSLQLQTCASISPPPWWGTIIIGPNLCQLSLQFHQKFQFKRHKMVHTNKKRFFLQVCLGVVCSLNYLKTLFTWTFLRCGKAYVSSRLWFWWNVCHNFFNFFIRPLSSISFHVHLQVVSTRNRFSA